MTIYVDASLLPGSGLSEELAEEIYLLSHEPNLWEDSEENEEENQWLDLRLRLYEGSIELLFGDSQYETDHRGLWAYSDLCRNVSLSEARKIVERMISDLRDQDVM